MNDDRVRELRFLAAHPADAKGAYAETPLEILNQMIELADECGHRGRRMDAAIDMLDIGRHNAAQELLEIERGAS